MAAPPPPPVLRAGPKSTIVREPGSRIRSLQCYPQVHQQLVEGIPVPEIAREIHEEHKEALDVARDSLVRALYRFKDTIAPAEMLAARLPRKHAEALAKVRQGLNELEELEGLFAMQKKRIEKLVKVEEGVPTILFPNLTNEMRVGVEMLREMSAMKKSMGIYTQGPLPDSAAAPAGPRVDEETLEVLAETLDAPQLGGVARNPESVHRVLSIFRSITSVTVSEEVPK